MTLDSRELKFLIRQIDEYIQVTEFMIRKTAALIIENSRWPETSGRSLVQANRRTSAEEHCQNRLGGTSLVSMMKSAHLRNFHNKTVLRLVDGSRLRRIFGQR